MRHSITVGRLAAALGAGAVGLLPVALVTTQASAAPAPITIAYVTDLTGPGGAENSTSPAGFQARIAMQNAEGGVHGHKLVPLVLDDQTSPSEIATAVQEADSKAFGIVSQSPLMFLAAKYPNQQGVPVTGTYDDGPEWGTKPYTNMFASDEGSVNPKYPVNTQIGNFLKSHGGTVLGAYGYGISPSSARAAVQSADSFKHAGGKVGVLDTSIPFGSVAFTSTALVAKQNHVNAMVPGMDSNSNYALATALKQAGVKFKALSTPPATSPTSSTGRPGARSRATTSCRCSGRGPCPTRAPSRCRRRWRSTHISPRASSPTSARRKPGPGPTS